jgi:outer membrane usher protein
MVVRQCGVKTDTGTLNVSRSDTAVERCSLSYALPAASKTSKQRWSDAEAVCTK